MCATAIFLFSFFKVAFVLRRVYFFLNEIK